jgi:hypothetical protein
MWKVVTTIALFVTPLIAMACGGNGSGESPSDVQDIPTIEIGTRWAVANYAQPKAVVDSSTAVFVGEVLRQESQRLEQIAGQRLGGSLHSSADKPRVDSSPLTIPVSEYSVRVLSELKGGVQPGSTVIVAQAGGITEREGGPIRVHLESDELLEPGQTFLFFAKARETKPGYSTSPLARLRLDGTGRLETLPEWKDLAGLQPFRGKTPAEAARIVASASGMAGD